MSERKKLVVHLGYHKTGTSSIQQWLKDHEDILAPHLKVYNLVDGGTNRLKFSAVRFSRNPKDKDELAVQSRRIADEIRAALQPVTCITDESLLGMPLGFRTEGHVENDVYPAACRIIDVLSQEFAEFDTTFVVMERDKNTWFRSLHNQMVKQNCFQGNLEAYFKAFQPSVDWEALRNELEFGIGDRGRLVAQNFEREFASGTVADMGFFQLLDIPKELMSQCKQSIPRINISVPLQKKAPQQTARKALVLGGSNSMLQGGWVNLLRTEYDKVLKPENLSIGACTSVMALYRFMATPNLPPRIPIIWEYGVNEYNHMQAGQSLDSLMYHIEWLLQLAIRVGSPFLPLLMRNRVQAEMTQADRYVTSVTRLFESYGVPPVDCNRLLHVLARGDVDLGHWYGDPAHYSVRTEFHRRLAETVALSLDNARVPTAPSERAEKFKPSRLVLLSPKGRPERFDNSIVKCDFAQFKDSPRIEVGNARPLAAIIVTSGSGPNIRLTDGKGKEIGRFATQVAYGEGIPTQQLRQLILAPGAECLHIQGGALHISVDTASKPPEVQNMFVQQPKPANSHPNGLVTLLCEQPK